MRRRKLTEVDLAYNARVARLRRRSLARRNIALLKLWRAYRKNELPPEANIWPLIEAGLLKYDAYGCLREWDSPDALYRHNPGMLAQPAYDAAYSHYLRSNHAPRPQARTFLWGGPF